MLTISPARGIALLLMVFLTAQQFSYGADGASPQPEFRLDRFQIALRSEKSLAAPVSVEVWNDKLRQWLPPIKPQDLANPSLEIDRTCLARDGSVRLRISPSMTGWIYLLPIPAKSDEAAEAAADASMLRTKSLAYARLIAAGSVSEVSVGLQSHQLIPRFAADGTMSSLELDGPPVEGLAGGTLATGELHLVSQSQDKDSNSFEFVHENSNPLRLKIRRAGDRLIYSYEYTVAKPLDRPCVIRSRFNVPGALEAVESLNWRKTHEYAAEKQPAAILPLSQVPFVVARGSGGAYVGILNVEASPIVARYQSAENALDVEQWLSPKMVGQTYRWTFEMLVGYEAYANGFLRALAPHTEKFQSPLGGAMASRAVLETDAAAKAAFAAGVRVVWLHGWFERNGRYWRDDRPLDAEYKCIRDTMTTYAELKEHVARGQREGMKVFVYFQFGGVSEDVASEFESSLAKNALGKTVRAGSDGGITNLWVNPNPDGVYGKAFLHQLAALLKAVKPDGIALDRADRLDYTYGGPSGAPGVSPEGYDFGTTDGYAAPPLKPDQEARPASSMTYQGERLMRALRKTLDEHNASLISNLPIAPVFYQWSEGVLIDQPMSPWKLFFMRAGANGKPFYIIDTTKESAPDARWTRAANNELLAGLSSSHPASGGTGDSKWQDHPTGSRLLYVIPGGASYPAYWIFSDGTSIFRYDRSAGTVAKMYAGSEFISLAPRP